MKFQITDVTLRDGLQMEARLVSVDQKLKLYEALATCPYDRLEVTSFVHPKWIPQFSDSEDFCKRLPTKPTGPELMAFVPNEKGLERLLKFPIPWASAFVAVSDTFNQKNVNQTTDETLKELKTLITKARKGQRKVRVYVSTVFGCPYEGAISSGRRMDILEKVVDLGADEIALSDTIGVAEPDQVRAILTKFLQLYSSEKTALHFHNTYGLALASIATAMEMGIHRFDGTTGGIGGCPYAKGATGNAASCEMLYLLYRQGKISSFPEAELKKVYGILGSELGIQLHSHLYDILQRGGNLYGIR